MLNQIDNRHRRIGPKSNLPPPDPFSMTLSPQSSGERDRQGQDWTWDPGNSSTHSEENKLDPNAPRFQVQQPRPNQLQQSTPQVLSSVRGGTESPHSRLTNYTSSCTLNPSHVHVPQSYLGSPNLRFQPIPQTHSHPLQTSQFQSSYGIPPHTDMMRQAASPWGQAISPQWSWQSNDMPSSTSSQISTPHETSRWGSLSPPLMANPNIHQSSIRQEGHPQVPQTLLPAMTSLSFEAPRRGTLAYNPLRPPSRSHESFSRRELALSPTVSLISLHYRFRLVLYSQ